MLDVQFDSELFIDSLVDKGYAILDDFLEEPDYLALSAHVQLLVKQNEFKPAHIGQAQAMHRMPTIRADMISWLDHVAQIPAVDSYFSQMQQLKTLLNQTLFLGLADFETHFANYPPGAFYKKHIDQFTHNKDRRISCVYYLNENWQREEGGQLILYGPNNEQLSSILPSRNRLVCFRSDIPHEVCKTYRQRLSIAAWFKVRASVL